MTAGIGAVIGGAVGDSSYNAQLAGVIGQNAVENNFLTKQGYKRKFELVNQFDKKGALTTQQAQELLVLIDLDNKSTKLRKLYLEKGSSALTKQEYADLMKYIKLVAEVDGVSPQKFLNDGRFGTIEPISKGAGTYAKKLLNYNNSYQQRQAESLGQGLSLIGGLGGVRLMGSGVAIGTVGGGAAGYVSNGDTQSIAVGAGVGAFTGYYGGKFVTKINSSLGKGGTEIGFGGLGGGAGTMINNGLNNEPLSNNIGKASVVGALVPRIGGRAAVSASGTNSKVANTFVDVNSALIGIGAEQLQKVKPKGNEDVQKK